MNTTRYAHHPEDFMNKNTAQLREAFLIESMFKTDQITTVYSHYDRLIIGGANPVSKPLPLQTMDSLKSSFFLERREIGIINVGGKGSVSVDGVSYPLEFKEALYIGKGCKEVIFHPASGGKSLYYFNSAPAHKSYPTKKISLQEAEKVEAGSVDNANHRTICKLIVNSLVETCHLQMGLTELKKGSIWNTMPPHTHDRRMEAYFYFDLPENQMVCHFMGQPNETRHLWVKNNEAVISPPWSIHSGAGTSNYTFIWGMAGENLDYGDMDQVKITDLK